MDKMYYYSEDGKNRKGPIAEGELRSMLSAGRLPPSTLVYGEGLKNWALATATFGMGAPPVPAAGNPAAAGTAVGGLPPGLTSWMGFVGVMNIVFGILKCLSCLGVIVGIILVISGAALLGAKTALLGAPRIDPGLAVFFQKLKTAILMMGWLYILALAMLAVGLIIFVAYFGLITAAVSSGLPALQNMR